MKQTKLEVCAYTLQSAINAQKGGAYRVELCDNMPEGGTTPSAATIALARKYLNIKLNIIIRPRGGDFCYSPLEFESIKEDIIITKGLGVNGVVIGMLTPDGNIDTKKTAELIKIASPLDVTFHRAIDMSSDIIESTKILADLGVNRILTSGGHKTAYEGKEVIKQMNNIAGNNTIIMPGCGITPNNVKEIIDYTQTSEVHCSAKHYIRGKMRYENPNISMGGDSNNNEYNILETSIDTVKTIIEILDKP